MRAMTGEWDGKFCCFGKVTLPPACSTEKIADFDAPVTSMFNLAEISPFPNKRTPSFFPEIN